MYIAKEFINHHELSSGELARLYDRGTRAQIRKRACVDERARKTLWSWATRKDKQCGRRLFALREQLDERLVCGGCDPRTEKLRATVYAAGLPGTYRAMTAILLDTECTLRDVASLRWSDVRLTRDGLEFGCRERTSVVSVEQCALASIPPLSMWVFDALSWKAVEKSWRRACARLLLPDDLFD